MIYCKRLGAWPRRGASRLYRDLSQKAGKHDAREMRGELNKG